MLYGLGAALGWGLADVTVSVAARRIGSFLSVVVAQLAGLALFGVLWLVARPPLPAPGGLRLGILLAAGVSGAFSYLAFYRGLELGPIALVSPIVAGYSAIVIALALLFLDEAISGLSLAGAGLTLAGVVLASTDIRALRERAVRPRGGVFFALLAMVGFGVGAFLIGRIARDVGWFEAILIARAGSAVALFGAVALRHARERGGGGPPPWAVVAVAAAGVVDILAFASFARGSELGRQTITAAASASYPLLPILAGVIYLRERLARMRWAGVALVVAGLLLLAAGR